MAGVEKRLTQRGEPRWRVHWREDGEKQSETFGSRDVARAFQRDVEAAGNRWPPGWVKGRGYPDADLNPSGFSVRSAALKAISLNVKASAATKADYQRELDRYLPDSDPLASVYVEEVKVQDILEWHARLAGTRVSLGGPERRRRRRDEPQPTPAPNRTLSAKTRMHAHSLVSRGLDLMVTNGFIPTNPAKGQGPTTTSNARVQALTPAQFLDLLTYIPEHYQPFVEALARTGMRFGEATALTVRQVNLSQEPPEIHVSQAWKRTTKFGTYELGPPKKKPRGRFFPIDERLAHLLRKAIHGKRPGDFVFTTITGVVIKHSNFSERIWRPAVRRAYDDGVIPFEASIHDLRHANASWLLAAGVPVNTAADRLGHEADVLLNTYAHLFHEGRVQAAEVIGNLLGEDYDEE
jgi:integrase